MNLVLQTLVSTVVQGSMLALITVGMSLIYGTLRVLNMAQGVMVMVGGVAAWLCVDRLGVSPWLALVLAMIVAALLGMLSYGIGISRLIGRERVDFEMTAFISTFAIAAIVQNLVQLLIGPRQKDFAALLGGRIALTDGVSITWHQLLTAVIAVAALAALGIFLSRSRYGLAIVAVAQQLDAARLVGIAARRTYLLTMGLAGALAGLAGVLLAPVYFVSPNMGELPMLQALIVAILAGLGSTRGTIIAAYAIGFVQAAVSIFWSSTYAMPVLYALIVAMLIARPTGIAGKPQEARL